MFDDHPFGNGKTQPVAAVGTGWIHPIKAAEDVFKAAGLM